VKESDLLYERAGHYVVREGNKYVVYRHQGTHAKTDSAYPATSDGMSLAQYRVDYLAGVKGKRSQNGGKKMHIPIVAHNPELLLIGNPRKRRRRKNRRHGRLRVRSARSRRRNGGAWRRIHKHWGPVHKYSRRGKHGHRVGGHKRRVNPGSYAAFVKRHKGLYKRMGFRAASKKIGMMWRRKH
jgi:hypothetical protein